MQIWPSLAAANQSNLKDEIAKISGHNRLHFDIEDGNFVPNITFGLKTIKSVRSLTDMEFDAHLMTTNPMYYINPLSELGFSAVAFHWEVAAYPSEIISFIQKHGMRAGIALKMRTPVEEIEYYLDQIDYVLVMTAEPDGQGELFQPAMLKKIKKLCNLKSGLVVVADGGVGADQIAEVACAGTSAVVIGRAIFQAENPLEIIRRYERIFCSV